MSAGLLFFERAPGLGQLVNLLGDIFLPPLCAGCGAQVNDHENLCATCWQDIEFISPPYCDILGIPLPYDPGGRTVSAAALACEPAYDHARAVARYSGTIRKLIHALKYSDRQDGWRLYGRWLKNAAADLLEETDFLIPIPLNRRRLWFRRFNQAALLADALARETGLRSEPLTLVRSRPTRSQVGLTPKQRRRNVSGAFSINKAMRHSLQGSNILLVDDVITTGATAEACARKLKKEGAARVDVVALARALSSDKDPF